MAGRPKHSLWSQQGFKFLKENNKCVALCIVCQKTLKNTAVKRLESHRNVCHLTSTLQGKLFHSNNAQQVKATQPHEEDIDEPGSSAEISTSQLKRKYSAIKNDQHSNNCTHPAPTSPLEAPNREDILCKDSTILPLDNVASLSCVQQTPSPPPSTSSTNDMNNSVILHNFEIARDHGELITTPSQIAFYDQMRKSEQEAANQALGKFIFGCNVPFSVVESKHFKNFVKILRPSYKPPCRKTVATTMLDKEYEDSKKNLNFGEHSVLLIDGWKNEAANTRNVAAMIHNAEGQVGFLNAWDITGEKETGEALKDIVSEAIISARDIYNSELYAVCSDNAANMMKMGKVIDMWHVTCNAHTGNLLAKELVPIQVTSRVNSVLKAFTSADQEARLLQFGGHRIILPCDTQWCSNRDAFLCLRRNLPAMKKVIAHGITIDPNIVNLMFDNNFLKQVDDAIALFEPVCTLINKCQQGGFSIADATEEWLQLKLPHGYPQLEEKVDKRREYALTTYGMAANLLHPAYRGKRLSTKQHDKVEDFLFNELDAKGLEDLANFKSSAAGSVFTTLQTKGVDKPTVFWELAKRKHPALSTLALKLLNIPAASAQLERVFSNWSYVHCPLRNRLTFERSKKLLHVYHTLKLHDVASDEY